MPVLPSDANPSRQARIAALVETLHDVEQQLQALTADEIDTVANRAGSNLLLAARNPAVAAALRAEQASLRSAELLQAVADGTPDVVCVKDLQGRYLLCNKALADFTGRSVEQILGCDDRDLYDAAEAAQIVENDRTLFATGEVHTSEKWLTGVSGRRIFKSTRAPYRNARGEVIGVIGVARDITDERLAEQALRDSKAMLDMAGRSAKVGGWTFDVVQRRLHWSDMVAGLHDEPAGYSPSMEQGLAAFAPEHRAAV
ncbi:MAG: PAS domain-containing protein, partial [Aquabacterium sp.]